MDTATQAERADFFLRPGPVVEYLQSRWKVGEPVGPDSLRWLADFTPGIDVQGEPVFEPPTNVVDFATARPGLTEAQELGGLFGIKPVQVENAPTAASRAMREVEARARQESGKAKKSAPFKREKER
jgi:hypothetical protein